MSDVVALLCLSLELSSQFSQFIVFEGIRLCLTYSYSRSLWVYAFYQVHLPHFVIVIYTTIMAAMSLLRKASLYILYYCILNDRIFKLLPS